MHIRDLIPWGRKETGSSSTPVRMEEAPPLMALQHDMNRVFDDFWKRFEQASFGLPMRGGLFDGGLGLTGPKADVVETDKAIEVSVELPGLDEGDIDVSVSDDVLTIKGEKKARREDRGQGYYLSERSYGSFFRAIPLPTGVEGDKAEADFRKGVLTVTLPKTPEAQAKVRRIEVKAG